MFGLREADIDEIRQFMQLYQEIDSAVLYGSRAMARYKQGSDVDLAIKGQAINFDTVLNIRDSLNEESNMPYRFDIVDYQTIHNEEAKRSYRSGGERGLSNFQTVRRGQEFTHSYNFAIKKRF